MSCVYKYDSKLDPFSMDLVGNRRSQYHGLCFATLEGSPRTEHHCSNLNERPITTVSSVFQSKGRRDSASVLESFRLVSSRGSPQGTMGSKNERS